MPQTYVLVYKEQFRDKKGGCPQTGGEEVYPLSPFTTLKTRIRSLYQQCVLKVGEEPGD